MKSVARIEGNVIVRAREEGGETFLEHGTIHPLVDGQPIAPGAELLSVERRENGLYDVETIYAAPRSGPAKVTSNAFRSGYDRIFGEMN